MRRWGVVLALFLSVGVNVGILATLAVHRLRPRPPVIGEETARGTGQRLDLFADRVGLEGERRERFLAVQRRFLDTVTARRGELDEVRRQLRRELTSRRPDPARVDALLAESARLHAALERALVENVLESREILEPDEERRFLRLLGRLRRAAPPAGAGPARAGRP